MDAPQFSLKQLTLGLSLTKGLGISTYLQAVDNTTSLPLAFKLLQTKYKIDYNQLSNTLSSLNSTNTNYICEWEESYPKLLKQIPDRPLVIFYIGNIEILNNRTLGVVGTRLNDNYGANVTKKFVSDLSNSYTIISGMAMGIDAIAMQTALDLNNNVVAVLAGAAHIPAPVSNTSIWQEIINKNGLIISEFPPGVKVNAGMFPRRNRIIAGLSNKLLVTQAGLDSGAIITAKLAFDYNKEVYAIPSAINGLQISGTNWLIQNNIAQLAQSSKDLDEYVQVNQLTLPQLTDNLENKVFLNIQNNPTSVEELAVKLQLSITELARVVAKLQVKGLISVSLSGNLITNQL